MHVRWATADDLGALTDIGHLFLGEVAHAYNIENPSVTALVASLLQLIRGDTTGILVAEEDKHIRGVLGASLLPVWFAPHVLAATETFWYVHPQYRGGKAAGLLLQTFEAWAKKRGAARLVMASITALRGKVVGRLLERKGYHFTEAFFFKEV